MSVFEWLGRVIMLVLAGMITLSIIGAIAAIPSGSNLPRQIGFERPLPSEAPPQAQSVPAQTAPEPDDAARQPSSGPQSGTVTLAPAQPEPVDPAEWLEVIAYALLALAGLGALGIVLLWRSLHQRRRIADALEALSAVRPASFGPPSGVSTRGS
jgi:hypothetical protein